VGSKPLFKYSSGTLPHAYVVFNARLRDRLEMNSRIRIEQMDLKQHFHWEYDTVRKDTNMDAIKVTTGTRG
jgi:hypothetical protein